MIGWIAVTSVLLFGSIGCASITAPAVKDGNPVQLSVNDSNSMHFETRLPIVKLGEAGSYFGYSVALHAEQMANITGSGNFDEKLRLKKW